MRWGWQLGIAVVVVAGALAVLVIATRPDPSGGVQGRYEAVAPPRVEMEYLSRRFDEAFAPDRGRLLDAFPLGYALVMVDGRDTKDVARAEVRGMDVDWRALRIEQTGDGSVVLTLPTVKGPPGAAPANPRLVLPAEPDRAVVAYSQGGEWRMWAQVLMSRPRLVAVVGMRPGVEQPPDLAALLARQ
jgi:hypothetical protein